MVTHDQLLRAGLSPRRIEHWTHKRYLRIADVHPGSGRPREWRNGEDVAGRYMVRLVDAGITPAAASRVAHGEPLGDGIEIFVDGKLL
jgi:Fe2+ transport system protein FeoA